MGHLLSRRVAGLSRRVAGALRRPAVRGVAAVAAIAMLAVPAAAARHAAAVPHPVRDAGPGSAAGGATAGGGAAGGRGAGGGAAGTGAAGTGRTSSDETFRRITLPDLLIVAPHGLTGRQIARLHQIAGFRSMITFDGAEIKAGGRPASVIGVNPSQFRSWVPLWTASDQPFWAALRSGEFVASQAAEARLQLRRGATYPLVGVTEQAVRFGAAARLGVSGVDLIVNARTSRALGLVRKVAALISAPGASLAALVKEVSAVLGPSGEIVSLRRQQLPVTRASSGQLPSTYLQLFQESATRYCPGMSWTVLAAIGQIESADGTNVGPSSAGALGPMQFLPSTWASWGIDGFGQTGTPNVLNPYDAVPSAARLLCADGAAAGGQALRSAIFAYNHATWYVNEVLALAAEYAADYH